jgi:hypothetical protein
MIQANFGLNWPSGFRGEDFFKSLQTDDERQVMAIAHTGELKMGTMNPTKNRRRTQALRSVELNNRY